MKIAGAVILYNPSEEIFENIETYLSIVEKLYVMDNSTKEHGFEKKFKEIKKVEYITMGGNQGIAKALKDATEKAIEEGYEFILTMDQDSKYPTEDFKYVKEFLKNEDLSKIGVISINFTGNHIDTLNNDKNYYEYVDAIIQSGSIYVLDNYKKIEGYNADLFIDYVDFDISAQFILSNYKIVLFRNILLNHQLGEPETRKFLWKKAKGSWHSPLRCYYIFRNFTFLKKIGRMKCYENDEVIWLKNKKVVFFSIFAKPNERFKTFKMIMQGISDGKKGILGKYENRKQTKKLMKNERKSR